MKRPEGFDASGPDSVRSPGQPSSRSTRSKPRSMRRTTIAGEQSVATPRVSSQSSVARPDAAAGKLLRRTARERRKFERAEVRRFTRRTRTRRIAAVSAAAVIVTLAVLVVGAVYSPFLALRVVTVDGAVRVSPEQITDAVDEQLGTPLALIDYATITAQLGEFPLIRSYVTEIVPPNTLILHIVEREPIGAIQNGSVFQLVDPAGVIVQESPERIAGLPIIQATATAGQDSGFDSVVEVLLALPPEVLAQVDSIAANTRDDVTLVLTGVGQRVKWGSAEQSPTKAVLLAALIAATDPSRAGEFDVSAPSNGVFRPA